jgi:hypothetical protein
MDEIALKICEAVNDCPTYRLIYMTPDGTLYFDSKGEYRK